MPTISYYLTKVLNATERNVHHWPKWNVITLTEYFLIRNTCVFYCVFISCKRFVQFNAFIINQTVSETTNKPHYKLGQLLKVWIDHTIYRRREVILESIADCKDFQGIFLGWSYFLTGAMTKLAAILEVKTNN